MKITLHNQTRKEASILMVALCIATIVGIVLGSYLYLIRTQNVSVVRSQHWNAAMAMAEAGVEEALAHLNLGPLVAIDKAAHGWTLSGGHYNMPNGPRRLLNGYYHVSFTDTEPPIIYSTGYVTVPITGDTVSRIIRVDTTLSSLFSAGIVARSNITMNGNNVTVNSYDSADPNHDNPEDPNEVKCNGDIASRFGIINMGNANICGTLHMGPDGTYRAGPNAIITGGAINDMNKEIPDVNAPFTFAPAPGSKTINGTNYNYVMGDGNYMISGSLNGSIYVYPGKTATLYVTGNATFSSVTLGQHAILKVYVGGPNVDIANVNAGGNPYSFQLWGLPTLTQLTLRGNNTFVGVIYAPSAHLTLDGGGRDTIDVLGALVIRSLTSNGHFNLHYDENLARAMPPSGYVAIRWTEL